MPDEDDRGTLAPVAAVASIPFAPEICIPAMRALRNFQDGRLYVTYAFFLMPSIPVLEIPTSVFGQAASMLAWAGLTMTISATINARSSA
jgi:hypothetical protein